MSAIIGTPPAPPLQRIGQLEKLILAGEGGFACGGVIGKDVISPAELALTMTFPPTCDIIETFMRTANPSPFGKGGETVLDAGYRNAREFKPPHFALSSDLIGVGGILASISTQLGLKEPIYATLNKINAYPTGGFFKAHRDTPLGKDHLGTITVCLPVPFTGGDLVVKQDQRTKTFAWEAAQDGLIEWAFLYSDCEHEVLPVTSGTRVTIAYDVWWCGDITAKDASKLGIDRSPIYKYLQALLDDKTHFLPKGGKIGFGMRHAYPVENTDEIPAKLKGVDRTVQLALLSLGLKWEIKAAYDYIYDYFGESSQESNDDMSVDGSDADAADNGDEPEHTEKDDSDIIEKVRDEDIISLRTTGYRDNVFCGNHPKWVQGADTESTDLYDVLTEEENAARRATDIIWITQVGAYGCESSYMAYGNEHTMDTLYSGACIIVTIPPAANRS